MGDENLKIYTQSTISAFSTRIREIRRSRGWTLRDVEIRSNGSITAVSMGSYERGIRSMSLAKSIEIATLFDLPLSSILDVNRPEPIGSGSHTSSTSSTHKRFRVVLDLRSVSKLIERSSSQSAEDLLCFLRNIARRRNDWNGEVISLRESDLETIGIMSNRSREEIYSWLVNDSLLLGSDIQ